MSDDLRLLSQLDEMDSVETKLQAVRPKPVKVLGIFLLHLTWMSALGLALTERQVISFTSSTLALSWFVGASALTLLTQLPRLLSYRSLRSERHGLLATSEVSAGQTNDCE